MHVVWGKKKNNLGRPKGGGGEGGAGIVWVRIFFAYPWLSPGFRRGPHYHRHCVGMEKQTGFRPESLTRYHTPC